MKGFQGARFETFWRWLLIKGVLFAKSAISNWFLRNLTAKLTRLQTCPTQWLLSPLHSGTISFAKIFNQLYQISFISKVSQKNPINNIITFSKMFQSALFISFSKMCKLRTKLVKFLEVQNCNLEFFDQELLTRTSSQAENVWKTHWIIENL